MLYLETLHGVPDLRHVSVQGSGDQPRQRHDVIMISDALTHKLLQKKYFIEILAQLKVSHLVTSEILTLEVPGGRRHQRRGGHHHQ